MNPHAIILAAVERSGSCAMVSVIATHGSVPREVGAWMVITREGYHGSIGGGTLEWHAMAEAQRMLGKRAATKIITKILGPDLGQCCGGRMELLIESFDIKSTTQLRGRAANFVEDMRHVHLWGAGHVGRALVMGLAPLPFKISWWDSRANAFPALVPQNVTCRSGSPLEMEANALVLVMSHSHALDFEIVDVALRNPAFPFVGLIGSQTKRARFAKRLRETGCDVERLTCPIGHITLKSKHPASIAAGIAVQLLEVDEMLRALETPAANLFGSVKV